MHVTLKAGVMKPPQHEYVHVAKHVQLHCDFRKRASHQTFQNPLSVLSKAIPVEHPNHTYSLQSRSLDFLENKTNIVTAAVERRNTFLKSEFLPCELPGRLLCTLKFGIHIAIENNRSLLNRK